MATVTRKERKHEQQKREILAAARELFLRDGHEHFSMRGLAREVGCVPGTLYLYFADKTTLIATLVEESFERLTMELERPRPDASPMQLLREMMHAYIEFGLANPNHYHFAFMLRRTSDLDRARPRPHRSFSLLRDTVAACIEQRLIGPVDVELAAQGVWTGIHGVTSLIITMPNFPWGDKATVVDHVVDTLLNGLRPPPETEGSNDDIR